MDSATLVYEALRPESFTVADLGCASGTNALGVVEAIVRGVGEACRGRGPSPSSPPPEFSVLLNDLASNDFNTVFARAPEVAGRLKADAGAVVFLSGVPGSFYGRLFLCRSVHLVCSFNSLHWLSQVPIGTSCPRWLVAHMHACCACVCMYITHIYLYIRRRSIQSIFSGSCRPS